MIDIGFLDIRMLINVKTYLVNGDRYNTQKIIRLQNVISHLLNDCLSKDTIKGDAELLVTMSETHIVLLSGHSTRF